MKKVLSSIGAIALIIGFLFVNQNGNGLTDILSSDKTHNVKTSEENKELINIAYDNSKYPENYATLNGNKTNLKQTDKKILESKGTNRAWQSYKPLDSLGRGQETTALVTSKVVEKRTPKYLKEHGLLYGNQKIYKRPPFPSYVHVSGEYQNGWYDKSKQRWKGQKSNNGNVDLGSYKGWIYNKSHTLAWSLGGDMETHNVTLGTRSQNVGSGQDGGMGYPESRVREAVKKHKEAKVYYKAEPVYKDEELVPRGTHVRAYSINDKGKTINLNIWVFNTQKDIDIDYKTGQWREK
ncbi:DNA/RNA non-specific endonuclease [Staphylococcus aureus]|uniref:DNA/RNA non-specific endonuclease n=1 Tax=Staphylococcus aureus TaxID=1280 RepID=UPI003CED6751